jgi:tetratricopeptide (TPR) repeat protein
MLGHMTLCLLLLSEMGGAVSSFAAPSPGYADAQPVGEQTPTVAEILADARQAVDTMDTRFFEFDKISLLLRIARAYALHGDENSVNTTLQHATEIANSSLNIANNLLMIARTAAQLGYHDSARRALEHATDINMKVEGKNGFGMFISVINAYADDLDDLHSANTIFRRVTRPCLFGWLSELWDWWQHRDAPGTRYPMTNRCDDYKANQVSVLIRHRNIKDALRIARSISESGRRQRAYVTIVQADDDSIGREKIAKRFLDDSYREVAFSQLAASAALRNLKEGNIEEALRIADTIENGNIVGSVYPQIAGAQARKEEWRHAKTTLQRALDAANRSNAHYRNLEYLPAIAGGFANLGEMESALQAANSILDEQYESYRVYRDDALGRIAKALARKGDIEGALRFVYENITEKWYLRTTLRSIIVEQARRGDIFGASKTLARNADRLDRSEKALTLIGIALAHATAGNWADSRKAFEEVPGFPGSNHVLVPDGLEELAKLHSDAGKINDIVQWTILRESPLLKSHALVGLAEGLLPRNAESLESSMLDQL